MNRPKTSTVYPVKRFELSGLDGISDHTVEMHLKLYEGYVRETNDLLERIAEIVEDGKVDQEAMPAFAELKRLLSFEYNGMVLHELYFGNLKARGGAAPNKRSAFYRAVEASFGAYDVWLADFAGVGKMRGMGWAICYQDLTNGRLSNHWVTSHEDGNVAGFNPILVMDLWEHAFLLDYKPSERASYIDAFFSNLDWNVVENRLGMI
jgi:superoxide dismutase, Fe-Mn family